MANEAIKREGPYLKRDFTVADGTGIEKGAFLAMTDPRTAIAFSALRQVAAGIAEVEKVASDGSTRLSVARTGVYDVVASGAVGIGSPLMVAWDATSGNRVMVANGIAASGAVVIGHALETASDAEVFQMELNIGAGGSMN